MTQLHELSQVVGGNLTSQADLMISGAASIARANATEITFASSDKHFRAFLNSSAAAAVVPADRYHEWAENSSAESKPCILVESVDDAFIQIAEIFKPPVNREALGVSSQAIVSPTAQLGENVCIHPGAVVMDGVTIGSGSVVFPNVTVMENSTIGCDVRIYPNTTIYENTVIGDRVIIHAGAVLGAFGFGYKSQSGVHQLSAQIGNVVVGDDVEIGANTTIDRGTYDSTTIGKGSKIDNLVMVGHNCSIGENNLLCSQVGVAGSCDIGDYVVMGGQVGVADHLTIGDQVTIGAKSGLMHDVSSGERFFGFPARPIKEEMLIVANRARLPQMRKQIKEMQKQIKELEQQGTNQSCNAESNGETKAA